MRALLCPAANSPVRGRHRLDPSPRRRWRPTLAATATAAVLAAGLLPAGAAPASAATRAKPIMFGAVGSSEGTVVDHQKVLGRTLRGLRIYKSWDDQLFGSSQTWARDTGHTLFMSIDSRRSNGSAIKWADVANARPGSPLYQNMLSQAKQIKAFKAQVFIAYNHEPDSKWSSDLGSNPAQFVAAWRKVISVYRAAGVRSAKFVWVMTAYSFRRHDGNRASLYYPGDSYVDDIGADGYNWYQCRGSGGWADASTIFDGQRQFGLQHRSKGLMIWEFSSAEDRKSPGRKARWFHDVENLFQTPRWSQYAVLLTWEGRSNANRLNCQFDYLSSRSATAAWKALGTDPAYTAMRVG